MKWSGDFYSEHLSTKFREELSIQIHVQRSVTYFLKIYSFINEEKNDSYPLYYMFGNINVFTAALHTRHRYNQYSPQPFYWLALFVKEKKNLDHLAF